MATPRQVSDDPELTICCICERKVDSATQCPHKIVGFAKHYFCRECVISDKLQLSRVCPACNRSFTVEECQQIRSHFDDRQRTGPGLQQIPCKNADNGCLVRLCPEQLNAHQGICKYANSNCVDCSATVIAQDLEVHKKQQCPKRQVQCYTCGLAMRYELIVTHDCIMRREIDELQKYVDKMTTKVKDLNAKYQDNAVKMQLMFLKVENLPQPAHLFQERSDVIVLGGCDGNFRLASVEIFDWCRNAWLSENHMTQKRSGMTSFVYKQQLYVAGGKWRLGALDEIEVLSFKQEEQHEWSKLETRLLEGSWGHSSVVYKDRLIVIGGYNGTTLSDKIYKINLDRPNSEPTMLSTLGKPIWNHSCQIINGKVYISGGMTGSENAQSVSDVWEYDIDGNSIKRLRSLPYTVNGHATVCVGNSVIILGGVDKHEHRLRTVTKYNVDSGRCQLLPPMNHARDGCAAVVTGNALVAIGGYDCSTASGQEYMNSAEYFTFDSYEWKNLPPMANGRSYANAVVKPTDC